MKRIKLLILAALLIGTVCVSGCSGSVTTSVSSSNSITESSVVNSSTAESSIVESNVEESSIDESSAEYSYYEPVLSYIAERNIYYNEAQKNYILTFVFQDQNYQYMHATGTAKLSIQDDRGNILYEKDLPFDESNFRSWTNDNRDESTYGYWIDIPETDVKGSTSQSGKAILSVQMSDMSTFDEYTMKVSHLPEKQVEIQLPETPVTHTDKRYSSVTSYLTIHSLTYKQTYLSSDGEASVEFEALISLDGKTGEDNISSSAEVGYKVYDEDGIVVTSGDIYTNNLAIGEKSKKTFTVNDLDPMKIYTLKLFDSV